MYKEYLSLVLISFSLMSIGWLISYYIMEYIYSEKSKLYSSFPLHFFLSLIIINVVCQTFAWIRLFSFYTIILLFIFIITVLRKEIKTFKLLIFFKELNFLKVSIFLILYLSFGLLIMIPTSSVDVYYYHLPVAEKIVEKNGLIFPLHENNYYGSFPFFHDFLYAIGLLFINDIKVASMLNYSLFFSFIYFLLSLKNYKNINLIKFIIVPIILFSNILLENGGINQLVDTPRAIYGSIGILFLVNNKHKSNYFYFISGLLIGADFGTKYLGLYTFIFSAFIFLFDFYQSKKIIFNSIYNFFLGLLLTGIPWYIKNLFFYLNPFYPYIFSHEGFSDKQMEAMLKEQTEGFLPIHRIFNREITDITSYFDALKAFYVMFQPEVFGLLILVGFIFSLKYNIKFSNKLYTIAFLMYFVWYFFVFNSPRYGIVPYTLLLVSFYIFILNFESKIFFLNAVIRSKLNINLIINCFLILCVILFLKKDNNLKRFKQIQNVALSLFNNEKYIQIQTSVFSQFEIVSYCLSKNLSNIFNPYDGESRIYFHYIYKNPKGTIFLDYFDYNSDAENILEFFKSRNIKYFILLGTKNYPLEDREPDRYKIINKSFEILIPKSKLIFTASNGDKLFLLEN
jgi:hypothetical protein